MKPLAAAVQTLPLRPGSREAVTLPFPVGRRSLARLRKLRERLFREGNIDQALQVAREVVRLEPGRESVFYLGLLLNESGSFRHALKEFRDALRFREGAKYLVAEIHLHAAFSYLHLGRTKEMGQALNRAYATRWKPRSESKIHSSIGHAYYVRARYREAFGEYVRAEAGGGIALERGRAAVNQGICQYRLGDLLQAARHLDRAIRIHERGGHQADLAAVRGIRSGIYLDLGQYHRALGMSQRAARAFRALGKRAHEARALQDCGYIAGLLGLWARSRAYVDRAIRLTPPDGEWRVLACALACRATACAYEEDFEESRRSLKQAESLVRRRRDWVPTLHLCRAHAKISALFGDWAQVRRWCRRAERVGRKAGDLVRVAEFRRMRAEAEAFLGRRRAAFHARKTATRVEALRTIVRGPMEELRSRARSLAASRAPLLVIGEDGRERIELAREVHAAGTRRNGPFVVVPCEQLSFPASDLAGHVEGAWSGASSASKGYVQRARGGTLVLDRLDELAPEGQKVLIRMVDGWVRPVGGPAEEAADVRVIAICRNPNRLIDPLRRRLEASVLRIPPLKERSSEIPLLIEKCLRDRRRITCDALAEMACHPWKGNLPELEASVDRLVALSRDSIGVKLVHRVLRTPRSVRVASRVHKTRALRQMALLTS